MISKNSNTDLFPPLIPHFLSAGWWSSHPLSHKNHKTKLSPFSITKQNHAMRPLYWLHHLPFTLRHCQQPNISKPFLHKNQSYIVENHFFFLICKNITFSMFIFLFFLGKWSISPLLNTPTNFQNLRRYGLSL